MEKSFCLEKKIDLNKFAKKNLAWKILSQIKVTKLKFNNNRKLELFLR